MTLLELLELLRKKWYLLVIFPLIFAGATAGYCWGFMTNDYTSSVSLYVLSKSSTTTNQGSTVSSSDMTASQQLANDIAVLAETDRVTSRVAKDLGLSNLNDFKISVSSSTTNRVITLNVTGKKAESAALVADKIASETSKVAVEVMDLEAVNIIDEAKVETTPSGPNRLMYTAVALLVGLFVAIALIVLMDMLNTTIKSPEEAEELFGLPVVGRMPYVKKM